MSSVRPLDKGTSNKTVWTTCAPLHNVLFGQYVYLATAQAETYLKICVLIYQFTYICPSLFDCEVNMKKNYFCDFQTLNLRFSGYFFRF